MKLFQGDTPLTPGIASSDSYNDHRFNTVPSSNALIWKDSKMNRERNNPIQIYLSDDEFFILKSKLRMSRMRSISAFIRHLIIYGYVYDIDYKELHEYNTQLSRIGSNINQIVRRVSKTGNLYDADVKEIKELMEKVWHTQESMLSKQPLTKQ